MLMLVIKLVYLMLPAYFANMSPELGRGVLKSLAKPIDAGAKFMGKPLLGSHKTWRGLMLGTLAGEVVFLLQVYLSKIPFFASLGMFDYSSVPIGFGFVIGFGAMLGDIVESFFKRRVNVRPGGAFIPFDQTDFIIGALVFLSIIYFPGWLNVLYILIISFLLHAIFTKIGYVLKIHKEKW